MATQEVGPRKGQIPVGPWVMEPFRADRTQENEHLNVSHLHAREEDLPIQEVTALALRELEYAVGMGARLALGVVRVLVDQPQPHQLMDQVIVETLCRQAQL